MRRSFSVPPKGVFSLLCEQVPEPPEATSWACVLRWLVAVMNYDDPQLHFAASCLSYALKNGGLSQKQSEACQRLFERIFKDHEAGDLRCQWFMSEEDFASDQIASALIDAHSETKH